MSLLAEYHDARRDEDIGRLRRVLSLRAMSASGATQSQIAASLGVTQSAVSQQLKSFPGVSDVHPELLVEAAAPILKSLATEHGYKRLAVFGSVARRQARRDSDIDLLVEAPDGTSSFDFVRFKSLVEQVLGRGVDLVTYGALTPNLDDDILREAVIL